MLIFSIGVCLALTGCGNNGKQATPATLPTIKTLIPPTFIRESRPTFTKESPPTFTKTSTSTPEPSFTPRSSTEMSTLTAIPFSSPEPVLFTYENQEFEIIGAYLGEKYSLALKMADPQADDPLAELTDKNQPAGTNCLIIVISAPVSDLSQGIKIVMELAGSSVIDQNDVRTSQLQDHFGFSIGQNGIEAKLIFFTPNEAASFMLMLPDGQSIPLEVSI